MTTTTIDDLPAEMISELFKQLNLKDLAACSVVNKSWYKIYSDFKVTSLAAFQYPDRLRKWCYPDRNIEDKELCKAAIFFRLANKPLLSNLKHLFLCGYGPRIDLNMLNRFTHLVRLEIDIRIEKPINFNLPKLKVLAFHQLNMQSSLSVDCPALEVLVYREGPLMIENRTLLEVKQPETIRVLDSDLFGSVRLAKFKNVNCLIARGFQMIGKDNLQSLPKLKEFHFKLCIENLFATHFNQIGTLNRIKRKLTKFMDDVRVSKGDDFKFRFVGFPLTKTLLDQIDFNVKLVERHFVSGSSGYFEEVTNEYIYLKNYHLIDPDASLDFINRLDYNCVIDIMAKKIPIGFLKKLTGLFEVKTKGAIQDANHFLSFLQSVGSLKSLSLDRSQLGQEFYDQLPKSAHSLVNLTLIGDRRNIRGDRDLELNFEFVDQLSNLDKLVIYQTLSIESFTSLVRWSNELTEVVCQCELKEKLFRIQKFRKELWEVYDDKSFHQVLIRTGNADEVLNYFEVFQGVQPINPTIFPSNQELYGPDLDGEYL